MIIVDLIFRLSILVALSVFSGFIDIRFNRTKIVGKIIQGLLFGGTAIVGMLDPVILSEGIIFDGRSVVISLSTLFFGPLTGIISSVLAILFRLHIGGAGALMGILVILSSYLIGLIFNYRHRLGHSKNFPNRELYLMGIFVHLTMITLMLTLPFKEISTAFHTIALTVIGIYPIITLLIGKILLDQENNFKFIDELSQKEKLHRITLKSIGEAVITTDIEGKIININPVALQLTGWQENESIGQPLENVFRIIDEKTRLKIDNPVQTVLSENQAVELSNHTLLISRNGEEIPIADSGSPILNESNEVNGVVLTFRDQTTEREVFNQLRESEKRFRLLYENAPLAYQSLDINGVILDVNPKWVNTMGYSSEEAIGKPFYYFISPESKITVGDKFLDFNSSGKLESMEIELTKKDGSAIIVSYEGKEGYDEFGNFNQSHCIFVDITDRIKAEENLLNLTEMQKAILDNAGYAIISTTPSGIIQTFNPAAEKMLGYSAAEVVGKKTPLIFHDPESFDVASNDLSQQLGIIFEPGFEAIIAQAYKIKSGDFEWIFIHKDGNKFPVMLSVTTLYNSAGKITGFLGIAKNISERKKMLAELIGAKEQAEKANKLKSEFLAQMSHEIRSPINAIINFSGLIEEELDDKKNYDLATCFSGIESASKRVIRTIDLILNMSELQLGTYEISNREIDLKEILETMLKEYSKYARSKNIDLRIFIESQTTKLLIDDYAVNQILANLIDNAIKYTEKGFINITLGLTKQSNIYFEVKDTGRGISKEYLPKLYEPFTQEEQGYTRKFEGNGLGLSLVKKYCDIINAAITVESEQGKGTTFKVIFPN
ncbi:MAG: hypothetical protein CVV23_04820 [Ignavibacteriae bacterium HGW-Ignavibacteriae-2]|jgi:PAS domain S-box-containing protein|nr:MAG: hypothetical protein CVV23_04820 [Ignavibacteriae bacterium HGW-Ignavibacteriae-2]